MTSERLRRRRGVFSQSIPGTVLASRARPWLVVAIGVFALPSIAHAHTSVKGLGDFISGVLHPLVTPSHVLLLLGIGLLAGRKAPPAMKRPMAVFIPLTALALGLTTTGWVKEMHPALLNGLALVAGLLLALDRPVATWGMCALFGMAALGMGMDSGTEPIAAMARAKMLLGTWLSLMVLVYDVAIYASLGAEVRWVRTALRIAGAWLVAISLMMLAFALRPTPPAPL